MALHGRGGGTQRRGGPGTATAMLLILPASARLLWKAMTEGYVDAQRFLWAGPATVIGIAMSIPLLFWLGRRLPQERNKL